MKEETEKFYKSGNDIWGLPQEYKGIKFYPIKINDTESNTLLTIIFQNPKNYIADVQVVKMSYLKFLLFAVQPKFFGKGTHIYDGIIRLLKNITQIDEVSIESEVLPNINDPLVSVILKIKIGEQIFYEEDFEIIREIVLEQNGNSVEYIEEFNPIYEEYLKFVEDKDFADTTLEDQLLAFCCLIKKTIGEIKDYTIYQFKQHFIRAIFLLNYENLSPLEVSGQIKGKTNEKVVKHFLAHSKKSGRYSDVLIKKEDFEKKSELFNPIYKQT